MKQSIIKNDLLGVSYEKICHSSGLTVYLYENHSYNSCYALYGTNFGSYDNAFSISGKEYRVPDGVAHFLEHKLFESEEQDAFQRFAKTGASANAYTSFDKTCYLFSASQNIHESLEILLDFVNHPYFTKESVAKEQGIIGQEITMYDDNPGWQTLFKTLEGLYVNSPVKIDIAGTIQTIAEITPETLYTCYNTFYTPQNMVLAVAGNFDRDRVLKLVDQYVKPGQPFENVHRIIPMEPDETVSHRIEKKMEISMPLFAIGYKEVPPEDGHKERMITACELLQEILFSDSTDLYCTLYDEGLINGSFGTEVFAGQRGREYLANLIEGESTQAEEVYQRITAYLEEKKKIGITAEELQRAKKVLIGSDIRSYNSLEAIATRLVSAHFGDSSLFEQRKILEDITVDEINDLFKRQYRADKAVFTVIKEK